MVDAVVAMAILALAIVPLGFSFARERQLLKIEYLHGVANEIARAGGQGVAAKIPFLVAVRQSSLEPGEEFLALWGPVTTKPAAFIEIEHRGKILQAYWTESGKTQH